MSRQIIYAGDPLCAWCFGFSTVYDEVYRKFKNEIAFSTLMGGLRVKNPIQINPKVKQKLSENWSAVTRRTGQQIKTEKIDQLPDFLINSEPPCRAVVTVRNYDPALAMPYYKALHKALYLDMQDITDENKLLELAVQSDVPATFFLKHFHSDAIKEETQNDFQTSANAGVLGLPAFILKDQTNAIVLNQGYKPINQIIEGIENWLNGKPAIGFSMA